MFHRVDDPEALDVTRYFELAELLPVYDGACRAAALRQLRETGPDVGDYLTGAPATGAPVADPAVHHHDPSLPPASTDDIASLAAMSRQAGFPGIEYTPAE